MASTNRSNTASASSGPGAPSGWYWTVSIGFSAWRSPSTERSLRLSWLTRNPELAGSAVADDLDLVVLRRHLDVARCRGPGPGGSRRGGRTAGGCVSAPAARPTIWWPRQIPSSGRPSSMTARRARPGRRVAPGRPGPGERTTPATSAASTSAAVAVCGSTRTRSPRRPRLRTMFALSPKSTIATSGAGRVVARPRGPRPARPAPTKSWSSQRGTARASSTAAAWIRHARAR